MAIKKEQDMLKSDNETWNPCLRELAKKMLNTPYGKTIQNVYDKALHISTSANYTAGLIRKYETYTFSHVDDGFEIIEGTLKDVRYDKAKPCHIGVFVLAYARTKMYNEIFSKTDVWYGDTDSALIRKQELDRLVRSGVVTTGNALGEYEIEMDNVTEFWSVAPKCYALRNSSGEVKMRLKGVSKYSGWEWRNKSGKEISLELFDCLIEDHRDMRFYCSHFHHRKGNFADDLVTI
nr:MAG: hypothetical protein DiTV3a_F26ORF1 [Diabrotica toursvirus 3a]